MSVEPIYTRIVSQPKQIARLEKPVFTTTQLRKIPRTHIRIKKSHQLILFLMEMSNRKNKSLPAREIKNNDKINNMSSEYPTQNTYNVDEKSFQHCLCCSVNLCNPTSYPGVGYDD